MQGITGKLSGKMGSAVFRVREGQQVVTQYNPVVKNPNTQGQQDQRAKFKLMSQLSAVMAPALGTLGTINRPARGKETQRNAFTRLNMSLVEVSTAGQEVTAKIPMEQVKLTSSFRNFPKLDVSSAGANGIEFNYEDEMPAGITTIRIVTVGYENNIPVVVDLRDVPAGEASGYNIQVPKGKYTVLAYGLIPSESAKASINIDNIHTPEDEDFISAIKLNAMVADGSMAVTMTEGQNVTVSI